MSATLMPTAALVACAMVVLTRATVREAMAGRSASRAGAGRLGETSAKPRATSMIRVTGMEGVCSRATVLTNDNNQSSVRL
jgi:hypothetical protein